MIRAEQLAGGGRSHLPVSPTLATFGSSLAGGMDMDSNGYPGRSWKLKCKLWQIFHWGEDLQYCSIQNLLKEDRYPSTCHTQGGVVYVRRSYMLDGWTRGEYGLLDITAHNTRVIVACCCCYWSLLVSCSRKTCLTEASTIPQCWHTSTCLLVILILSSTKCQRHKNQSQHLIMNPMCLNLYPTHTLFTFLVKD